MPIQEFSPFPTSQAYSSFDFSPLARLGQSTQQRQLSDLARYAAANPTQDITSTSVASPSAAPIVPSAGRTEAPYSGNKQAVAQGVASELRAQGFSEPAIAGILYNVGQESSFDPTLRHPDQPAFGGEAHYAHGLFQEGGGEWNTFASDPARAAAWQDPTQQTRYIAGRLKGDIGDKSYANVYIALQNAKTPEEAAKIFARGYLKPADRYLASRFRDIDRGIPGVGFYTGE